MRFIFVGGCGRSGTTLVQKILSLHSEIAGGPEFDFSNDIMELYKKMNSPFQLDRQKFFYDQAVLSEIFKDFYSSFFEPLKQRQKDIQFVSEKTPVNIFVADTLLELFKDAYFINVVRDGRDVLVSHLQVKKRYKEKGHNMDESFSLNRVCALWNEAIDKYYQIKSNEKITSRIYNVSYEKLVNNSEEEIKNMFLFLGLNFEENSMHPENVTAADNKIEIDDVWYTRKQYEQPLNSDKIGRWKNQLSFFEKRNASKLMKSNLIKLGYTI